MRTQVAWFFGNAPVALIAVVVLALLVAMLLLGNWVRRKRGIGEGEDDKDPEAEAHKSFVISGSLGLMALLLGFTFSLAIERFDARRVLVLQEANAIGTTYLRVQLLDEPWRTRLSKLLEGYTENRLALAKEETYARRGELMTQSDAYQAQIWSATVAAIRPIRDIDLGPAIAETTNEMIDTGAARVAARRAHIPQRVLVVLMLYMMIATFILGYFLSLRRRWISTLLQLVLITIAFTLIIDIDQPIGGGVRVSQKPMEDLLTMMRSNPPASFGTVVGTPAPEAPVPVTPAR